METTDTGSRANVHSGKEHGQQQHNERRSNRPQKSEAELRQEKFAEVQRLTGVFVSRAERTHTGNLDFDPYSTTSNLQDTQWYAMFTLRTPSADPKRPDIARYYVPVARTKDNDIPTECVLLMANGSTHMTETWPEANPPLRLQSNKDRNGNTHGLLSGLEDDNAQTDIRALRPVTPLAWNRNVVIGGREVSLTYFGINQYSTSIDELSNLQRGLDKTLNKMTTLCTGDPVKAQ